MRAAVLRWAEGAGRVLSAWAALLLAEHVVVALAYRAYIAGAWEIMAMRSAVLPVALAALAPAACTAALLSRPLWGAAASKAARRGVAIAAALAGGAVGYGVSFGRHFDSVPLRAAFVAALAVFLGVAALALAPAVARARARPALLAGAALAVAVLAWLGDAFVLPRLYPAFHLALFVVTLAGVAVAALAPHPSKRPRVALGVAVVGLALASLSAVAAPGAARRLRGDANLRILLVERAPLMGRAIRVSNAFAPPEDDDAAAAAASVGPANAEIPRALAWTNRDVVLLSVDALRADHVSAYGYARKLTPSLDALAAEGMLFEAAYCPTPHTSYSVTSMMTGKYMRPLLALGLGEDSETLATSLRRYDYRTAAFYPPAVFFIDPQRFERFQEDELGFEYAKVEFATAELRAAQVTAYLRDAPRDHPLLLWVHLFEPHEPYVMHPEHPMGDPSAPTDVDAYDSEVAAADEGIGAVVDAVRANRPGAVVIATADHGEEFGEHGGRYHGTTVYEEQVRVPLVVVGPGVAAGARAKTVVQTIDILPTVISALGIPRPARVRGRDLGPVLAGKAAADPGFAFAETDDYALAATGADRLVCARKAAACALFDVSADPGEAHDLSAARSTSELRAALRAVEQDTGKFEAAAGPAWPEALRRGMEGEADAAPDVATLLDDANVGIRRKAAEVLFELRSPDTAQELGRAFSRDEDEAVKRWCALALARFAGTIPSAGAAVVDAMVLDPDPAWRRPAALVLAERGDARGGDVLALWWRDEAPPKGAMELDKAKELLAAIALVRARAAVAPLVASLDDVRLRPFIADALGKIGDPAAAAPLLAAFTEERYVTSRPAEARALVALGVKKELFVPLTRFAGVPQPMTEAIAIAHDAGLLSPRQGGFAPKEPSADVDVRVTPPDGNRPLRLLVLSAKAGGHVDARVAGEAIPDDPSADTLHVLELGPRANGPLALRIGDPTGVVAVWVVPHADELPPPPPTEWRPDDPGGSNVLDLPRNHH